MQIRTRGELEQLGDALLEPLFPVARGHSAPRYLHVFTRGTGGAA
jgi:hypothetical protein